MSTSKNKNQLQWGKSQLVDKVFEMVKSEEMKITKSQLNKVIEIFLQTIKSGLESEVKVALKDNFSLFVATTKETLKNNPRDRQQKLIIPAQKRVRIKVSKNWKISLNPLMKATEDLKEAKKINDLEMVYKTVCSQEIYQANKKRIDSVYNECLSSLRVGGKK